MERERPEAKAHLQWFLDKLERDFSGTPTRDPQELADLALNIARTPASQRVLRYTVGDDFELNAVRDLNQHFALKQESSSK